MTTIRGVLVFVFSAAVLALTVGLLSVTTMGEQEALPLMTVGAFTASLSGVLLYLTRHR